MLQHLNHPFLCNLRYSFQDFEYLYLVVDLMNGGDLRFHISRKTFEERAGIVHRDVKPDNVLLDSEGHVHLADFNVAADYTNPKRPLTSKSGTLAYLAPEVYEDGPYKCEVDWWSLGVCFYECIYGKRPFDARSHEDLANKVKAASPKYPSTDPKVDTSCVAAIQRLICRDTRDRIGANGFETFTSHPFFRPIDFYKLDRKEVPPVFIPSSEKTNFDATYDLEELLLEEAPLEARARHQKPRPKLKADASDQEKRSAQLHEMIEEYFEPFDYTHAKFEKYVQSSLPPVFIHPSCTHDMIDRINESTDTTSASTASGRTQDPATQALEGLVVGDEPVRTSTPTNTTSRPPSSSARSPPTSTNASTSRLGQARSYADHESSRQGSPEANEIQPRSSPSPSQVPQRPQRAKSIGGGQLVRHNTNASDMSPAAIARENNQRIASGGKPDATTTADSAPHKKGKGGIVGLLSGKKMRGKSPSSQKRWPDGVLGKDGARVWVKE
ncbi:MAG: hypothetical protein M1831_004052 [Alyxoria varia]|nr:MAG: hypothetical protein M1831_004052 [Alyxoria varia]